MSGFGDFSEICRNTPLPLCASIGSAQATGSVGIEPNCYARNIELANTIIFEGGTSAMHIAALVMTVIMILHIRGKFTAVGKSLGWAWRLAALSRCGIDLRMPIKTQQNEHEY